MNSLSNPYDPEFKMEVVLEVIKGKSYSQVAEEYGVSRSAINKWKNQFKEAGLKSLQNRNKVESEKDAKLKEKEEKIKEMKKIIGEQQMQLEILKKKPWQD